MLSKWKSNCFKALPGFGGLAAKPSKKSTTGAVTAGAACFGCDGGDNSPSNGETGVLFS